MNHILHLSLIPKLLKTPKSCSQPSAMDVQDTLKESVRVIPSYSLPSPD